MSEQSEINVQSDISPAFSEMVRIFGQSDYSGNKIPDELLREGTKFYINHFLDPKINSMSKMIPRNIRSQILVENSLPEDSVALSAIVCAWYLDKEQYGPMIGARGRYEFLRALERNLEISTLNNTQYDQIAENLLKCPGISKWENWDISDEFRLLLSIEDKTTGNIAIRIAHSRQHIDNNLSNSPVDLIELPYICSHLFKTALPNYYNKAIDLIQNNIVGNSQLSHKVVDALMQGSEFTEEILLHTIEDPDAADYFINASLDDNCPWISTEWFHNVFNKAQSVILGKKNIGKYGFNLLDENPFQSDIWALDIKDREQVIKLAQILNPQNDLKMFTFPTEIQEGLTILRKYIDEAVIECKQIFSELEGLSPEAKSYFQGNTVTNIPKLLSLENVFSHSLAGYFTLISHITGDINKTLIDPIKSIKIAKFQWVELLKSEMQQFNGLTLDDKLKSELNRQNRIALWSVNSMAESPEDLIKKSIERYKRVLTFDVPLYNILYDEFDELRGNNKDLEAKNVLEVYLGRDGIYAYSGRRALRTAHLRGLGPDGRKRELAAGVFMLRPEYIIFPRFFRDNLNLITKKNYINQYKLNNDGQLPVFFDTGYTGSIPEQILKIMGYKSSEIDSKIRLLTSDYSKRLLKGIEPEIRENVIQFIEHNSKQTYSSIGLMKNSKNGKIESVQRYASPDDQFIYSIINAAIVQYYYVRELTKTQNLMRIN